MPNEKLQLSVDLVTTGQSESDALSQSLQRLIDISQRTGTVGGRAGEQVAQSFGHALPQVAAASGAIRALEGNFENNIRAAERFLTSTLKLGPALQTIFPAVGAAALLGAVSEIATKAYTWYQNTVLLKSAYQEIAEINERIAASTQRAIEGTHNLQAEALRKRGDLVGAANLAVQYFSQTKVDIPDVNSKEIQEKLKDLPGAMRDLIAKEFAPLTVGDLSKRIGEINTALGNYKGGPGVGGHGLVFGPDTKEGAAFHALMEPFIADLKNLTIESDAKLAELKANVADAGKEQNRPAVELLNRVNEYAKSAREFGLGPVSLAVQKRDEMLAQPGVTSDERATINESGALEIARALAKIAQDNSTEMGRAASYGLGRGNATGRVGADYANMPATDFTALVAAFGGALNMSLALDDRITASLDKLYSAGGTGIERENSDAARTALRDFMRTLEDTRAGIRGGDRDAIAANADKANQAIQRLSIGARPEDAARIANETLAIRNQQFEADRAILDSDIAAYGTAQQRAELGKLQGDLDNKAYDASEAHFRAMQEIVAKQTEQARAFSGSLFDSVLGGSRGIENFIKGQFTGVGRTIFQNATEGEMKKITGSLPHASDPNSTIGKLLAGTPFGATKFDTAGDKLANSALKLNAAADHLMEVGTVGPGTTGGGGSSSGWPSLVNTMASINPELPKAITWLATLLPDKVSDLSGSGLWPTLTDPMAGIKPDLPSPMISTAAKVAAGIGVAGGGFAAYQGFSSGGARGALEGSAGVIGAATSALSLAKGIASSIPVIGAVATTVLGLAGSFLGDPKRQRSDAISKELTESQYMAPTAINKTVDSSGNYMDRDSMGNLRTSPFSGTPETTNPYLFWAPGNQAIVAPGGVTSPFTPAPQPQTTIIINHNYSPGAIQAVDAKSFGEMLDENHQAVGDAAAKNLGSGHTALAQRIQYVQR